MRLTVTVASLGRLPVKLGGEFNVLLDPDAAFVHYAEHVERAW